MSISCACLSLAPLPHLNTSPYVPPFLHLFVEAYLPSCLKLAFNKMSKLVDFCHVDLPLQSQLRNLQHGSSASVANSFSSLSFGEVENGQATAQRLLARPTQRLCNKDVELVPIRFLVFCFSLSLLVLLYNFGLESLFSYNQLEALWGFAQQI